MILYGFFGCPQKSHESPSSPNARKPALSSTCGPTRGSSNSRSSQSLPRGQNPRGLTRSRATERALPRRGALERATQSRCRFWPQTTQKVSRSHASRESAGLITLKQMRHSLPSSSGSRRRSLACFFLHAKQLNENTEAFTQPDNIACLQLSKLNIQPFRCPMTSIPPSVAVLALYAREFLSAPDSTCLGHQRLPDMAQGAPSDFPLNICHTAHKTQRPHMTSTSAFDALDVPLSRTRVGTYSASHGLATQGDPTTHHQSVFAASPDRERPDRPSDAVHAW